MKSTSIQVKKVIVKSNKLHVACLNNEKGNTFNGDVEIGDEPESFDEKYLNIEISKIIFGDYCENRITNI